MTEEQKANDANRYVVIDGEDNEVYTSCETEGDARKEAETASTRNIGREFIVYQKVGTAKTIPTLQWKGAAR